MIFPFPNGFRLLTPQDQVMMYTPVRYVPNKRYCRVARVPQGIRAGRPAPTLGRRTESMNVMGTIEDVGVKKSSNQKRGRKQCACPRYRELGPWVKWSVFGRTVVMGEERADFAAVLFQKFGTSPVLAGIIYGGRPLAAELTEKNEVGSEPKRSSIQPVRWR